jgi:hybrid polyketide synthase/nonribosomal peptide synthetase ACE1
VVGGKTAAVRQLVSDVADLMKTRYEKLARVEAFEDLAKLRSVIAQSTVVVACELDEPLMADPTPEKHEALQVLWRDASIVIWISEGARDSNPHAFMTVGLGRCIQYEYPNITLQRIDVDGLDAGTPHVLGSELLRLESLTAWNKQMQQEQQRLLWSVEPEIYFQHGRRTIPRLYPSRDANDRYNSLRRPITRDFNPQEWALLVNGSSSPSSSLPHELHCASPLRLPTAPSQAVAGTTKTLRVSHFLLRTLDVVGRSTSRLFLCAGFDQATGEEIVALSRMASASCACVLADWTAPLSSLGQQHLDTADLLVSLAAQIMVQSIFKLVPGGGTLVVHEPDERLVVALQQHARAQAHAPGQGFVVVVTTSVEANAAQKGWRYIHGESPRWNISRLLPAAPSAFLDLAPLSMPASSKAGKRIAECLPSSSVCYDAGAVLGSETSLRPDMGIHLVTEAFRAACAAVAKEPTNSAVDLGPSAASAAIPLSDLSLHPASVYWGEHLAVVECSSQGSQGSQGGLVPAIVRPIDKGVIFQPDKTYCLFGIANEVGQSLCRWMIKHGARHIVMTSRRPNVHPRFIEAQKALGATLMVRSW